MIITNVKCLGNTWVYLPIPLKEKFWKKYKKLEKIQNNSILGDVKKIKKYRVNQ